MEKTPKTPPIPIDKQGKLKYPKPIEKFQRLLRDNHIDKNDPTPPTHLSLMGGKYNFANVDAQKGLLRRYGKAIASYHHDIPKDREEFDTWIREVREDWLEQRKAEENNKTPHVQEHFEGIVGKLQSYEHRVREGFFLVEVRTPIFRYYIDFDFEEPSPLPPSQQTLLLYAQSVQRALRLFYPDRVETDPLFEIVICASSEPKQISETQYKHGIHFYAPNLMVDSTQARDIRMTILYIFENAFGPRDVDNNWEIVIDESVYIGSGLRVPWSFKAAPCREKTKDHSGCGKCKGTYRVFDPRYYKPEFAVNSKGDIDTAETQHYAGDFVYAMKKLSIRNINAEETTIGYHLPANAPRHVPEKRQNAKAKQAMAERAKQSAYDSDDERLEMHTTEQQRALDAMKGKRVMDLKLYPCIVDSLGDIKKRCGQWDDLYISKVFRVDTNDDAMFFMMAVAGPGSHYCLNKGDHHNSSSIWFLITKDGAQQKCFCRKPTISKDPDAVSCGKYASIHIPINGSVIAMFGGRSNHMGASSSRNENPALLHGDAGYNQAMYWEANQLDPNRRREPIAKNAKKQKRQ